MALLIKESDLVTFVVIYTEDEKGNLTFHDVPVEGSKEDTFSFRKPTWKLMNKIMVESLMLSSQGALAFNPFVFMDIKLKSLLAEWSLIDANGKKVPVTESNIEKLNPALCDYLNSRLDSQSASGSPKTPQIPPLPQAVSPIVEIKEKTTGEGQHMPEEV